MIGIGFDLTELQMAQIHKKFKQTTTKAEIEDGFSISLFDKTKMQRRENKEKAKDKILRS